jgi:hypothetical protein
MGLLVAQTHPSVPAFPETTIGSACTSSFSRIARRSLTLRPAHSRGHQNRDRYPKASDTSSPPCLLRSLPAGAVAGRGLHPLETRRLVTAHVDVRQYTYKTCSRNPTVMEPGALPSISSYKAGFFVLNSRAAKRQNPWMTKVTIRDAFKKSINTNAQTKRHSMSSHLQALWLNIQQYNVRKPKTLAALCLRVLTRLFIPLTHTWTEAGTRHG